MKAKPVFLIAIILFSSLSSWAQDKLWEVDMRDVLYQVGWIKQSTNGLIIASGAKGLLALDNNTGETIWHNEGLKAVDKNSFQNIEGFPLFFANYNPEASTKSRGASKHLPPCTPSRWQKIR